MMSRWSRAALYVYAALCGVVIYAWPRNKYEWMLDDPDAASEPLSFCTLPVDPDAALAPWFAFVPLLALVAMAVALSRKRRRIHPLLVVALLLLLAWAGKFYLFGPRC
jgi:hypothetical protein